MHMAIYKCMYQYQYPLPFLYDQSLDEICQSTVVWTAWDWRRLSVFPDDRQYSNKVIYSDSRDDEDTAGSDGRLRGMFSLSQRPLQEAWKGDKKLSQFLWC